MHLYYKYKLLYVWMQLFTRSILISFLLPAHIRCGIFQIGVQAVNKMRIKTKDAALANHMIDL